MNLTNLFEKYNSLYFDNKLPKIEVIVENLSDTEVVGYFDPDDNLIGLSDELGEVELNSTLLHEMTHLWDFGVRGFTNHDNVWQTKAKEIEQKTNLKLIHLI